MLHWVRSFSAIALLAAVFTLAPPIAALAVLLVWVFAALALTSGPEALAPILGGP